MRLPATRQARSGYGSHSNYESHFLVTGFFFLFLLLLNKSEGFAQECLSFQSPPQARALNTGVCTLSVDACDQIKSVTFHAEYLAKNGLSREELEVATITRAPFKFLWDITSLSNQLFEGMSVSALATREDGSTERISREGIFLTHENIQRPEYAVQYAAREEITSVRPITLLSSMGSAKTQAFISWNQDELVFFVDVQDELFYTNIPKDKYSDLGIEILLDPLLTHSPYPSKHTLSYVVPLKGAPRKLQMFANMEKDGSFELVEKSSQVDFPTTIQQEDFKGYRIRFCIPKSQFGNRFPQTFGFNIVAKILNSDTEVQKMSWVQSNPRFIYSPFMWGVATLQSKPLFANRFYLWLSSFFIGLLIGAVVALIFSIARKKSNTLRKFELSEEDTRAYETIIDLVENNITKKNLILEKVAKQTRISPRRINTLLKKNQNEDFNSFVMKSRVEIAKERLRSSHSSETSIAALCGFRSVEEMEKQFKRFVRTTPYRFREENQIT